MVVFVVIIYIYTSVNALIKASPFHFFKRRIFEMCLCLHMFLQTCSSGPLKLWIFKSRFGLRILSPEHPWTIEQ